jgi:hypothetical protein
MSLQHELDALRRVCPHGPAGPRRALRHQGYGTAADREIALAEIELEYRERLEPGAIVAALRTLRSSMTKAA